MNMLNNLTTKVSHRLSDVVDVVVSTINPNDQPRAQPPDSGLLFCGFNQDHTCVCVGTQDQFRIYQCNPFRLAFTGQKGARQVVMLFATSLIALVGAGEKPTESPRSVILFNTKLGETIVRLNFDSTVLQAKMNRSRLVVALERKIHIFDLGHMHKSLYNIETESNPKGIMALSPETDGNWILAFPGADKKGQVVLFDTYNLQTKNIIQAHDSEIQALALNRNGNYVATASSMGTVIRVFSVTTGQHMYNLRRGRYPTTIQSLSFSPSMTFICSSSATDTIHIFNLQSPPRSEVAAVPKSVTELFPEQVQEHFRPARSFAWIRLRNPERSGDVVMCGFHGDRSVVVATQSGYFYRYEIPREGGECKLVAEHSLRLADQDEMGQVEIFRHQDQEEEPNPTTSYNTSSHPLTLRSVDDERSSTSLSPEAVRSPFRSQREPEREEKAVFFGEEKTTTFFDDENYEDEDVMNFVKRPASRSSSSGVRRSSPPHVEFEEDEAEIPHGRGNYHVLTSEQVNDAPLSTLQMFEEFGNEHEVARYQDDESMSRAFPLRTDDELFDRDFLTPRHTSHTQSDDLEDPSLYTSSDSRPDRMVDVPFDS